MDIREATPDDGRELQRVQAKCPMGAGLIVDTVNTPDFFARAKAYERCRVFVASDNGRIIGSAAATLRNASINGRLRRIGYEFQYFIHPGFRRQGVAAMLHRHMEAWLKKEGAVLSFLVIIEGNKPSVRLFESQGFQRCKTLVMPTLFSYKAVEIPSLGTIRQIAPEDLATAAGLMNNTWQGHDFYEPQTAGSLARFIEQTPGVAYENFFVLENGNDMLACLGAWDWSRITRLTVRGLSVRLKFIKLIMDIARFIRPMPGPVQPGTTLNQWCLSLMGFKTPACFGSLLRHVNNVARDSGIDQILFACEQGQEMLKAMKGLFAVNVGVLLYVKSFGGKPDGKHRVFLNGIDL